MTKRSFLTGTVSAFVLVGVWQIAAAVLDSPFILPGPLPVFLDCITLAGTASFRVMLAATFFRGLVSFSVSLVLSFLLGFASGISQSFSSMMRPWMTIIKSTPVVSFILIALLWFGSSKVPVFVAVLMTMPVMTEAIAHGVKSSNTNLLEMAHVYRMKRSDVIFHIRLPSAMPFFLAGAGASLGLTWKVVVAGEILSSPRLGIGSAMQTAKVHLESARVFSLTIAAILLSVGTELLFDYFIHLSKRHMGKAGA